MNTTEPSPPQKKNTPQQQKTQANTKKTGKIQVFAKGLLFILSKNLTPSFFYYIYDGLNHGLVMYDVYADVLGLSKHGTQ